MNKIETTLEQCLNEIQTGESSLDECLARYPDYAAELTSLLHASTRLARARDVMPSPVFKARTRTELNAYIHSHPRVKRPVPFVWRLAFNALTTFLAFFILGTAIAQRALPGDTLYSWKLSSERVWRTVSIDRLQTDLTLSNRRVKELVKVYGDENRRARAVQNYQQVLIRFKSDGDMKHQERIVPVLKSHQKSLHEVGISIPELDNYFSPGTKDKPGEQSPPVALGSSISISAVQIPAI
jgi:hypothetical protein